MNVGIISTRYARALLAFGVEKKIEDALFLEMKALVDSFFREPRLKSAMTNPVISTKDKESLIGAAVGATISIEMVRFVQLVLLHKRENHLLSIGLMYIDLYRTLKHIHLGKLITAAPVSEEVENRMKAIVLKAAGGTVEFETSVDPELEGGFIFYLGTYRLDASIATQFRRIKQQFVEKNRRIV